MVDEIPKLEQTLFQVNPVKRVREATPRPEDRRCGRDTYFESDEVGLLAEREELADGTKRRRRSSPEEIERENRERRARRERRERREAEERRVAEQKAAKKNREADNALDQADEHAVRHIDIIV